MKQIGILLPIFSLPSKYGIGDFGYEAKEFIDILSDNNIGIWEILPITAPDGKLVYSPISYYALNPDYISIDKLIDDGLLKNAEIVETSDRIKYNKFKEKYYKIAYENFNQNQEYQKYTENNPKIQEYSEFMSENTNESKDYYIFLQYILNKQWMEIAEYAKKKNVEIIGDMPIYPTFNSCEVKYNLKNFDLENGKMKYVSGVPGDEFNSDGQIWNNPVYDFKYMKTTNYKYLVDRFVEFSRMYDITRIDHFKAFEAYYKIPINEPASNGHFEEGPKYGFFDELFKYVSKDKFVVEDMGNINDETIKLKEKYEFTGMEIFLNSVNLKKKNLIDKNLENDILYTSNHDTSTIIGWYNKLSILKKIKLKLLLKLNKCNEKNINENIIQYCMNVNAKYVIIQIHDILGLDDSSRINCPGLDKEENWSWKLKNFDEFREKIKILNKK